MQEESLLKNNYSEKPEAVADNTVAINEYFEDESGKMNTLEFCINLMKGIAGTGSLAIPFAFKEVGILSGVFLFALVCGMMILATYQLISINEEVSEHPEDYPIPIQTNNVYAELVYKVLGKAGYWVYFVASLITLYGSNVGSMVVMTDFLSAITIKGYHFGRLEAQIILTILCIILCILKDPKMLVGISSFGLITIALGFIVLIGYGIYAKYPIQFEVADLFPKSFSAFLQNIGIIVYCMGFILFLLTQYKYLKRDCKKTVVRSTGVSITIMAIIYSIIGIALFELFKHGPKGVDGNILNSLPSGIWVGSIVNAAMVFTVIGGFPLWMEPINEMVEGKCGECRKGKVFITNPTYIVIRSLEVIAISAVAYLIPFFSDILDFIGNCTDVITTFIFPAVMHLVYYHKRNTKTMTFLNYATLVVSTFIMFVCTTLSLMSLIDKIKHHKEGFHDYSSWDTIYEEYLQYMASTASNETTITATLYQPTLFPLYDSSKLVICNACETPVCKRSADTHKTECVNSINKNSKQMNETVVQIIKKPGNTSLSTKDKGIDKLFSKKREQESDIQTLEDTLQFPTIVSCPQNDLAVHPKPLKEMRVDARSRFYAQLIESAKQTPS